MDAVMKTFRKEDVVGKTVIETSGTVKGKIRDVVFDLSGTITLVVEGTDGKDWQVPVSRVTGISDHVIAKEASTELSCRYCGAPLKQGQTLCPSCGKAQM